MWVGAARMPAVRVPPRAGGAILRGPLFVLSLGPPPRQRKLTADGSTHGSEGATPDGRTKPGKSPDAPGGGAAPPKGSDTAKESGKRKQASVGDGDAARHTEEKSHVEARG